MITALLGRVVDSEACTDSDKYIGYCIDMAAATQKLPGASDMYIAISTAVAADYGTGNETYQIQLRTGTGTDGTDINAGAITVIETPAMDGDDARVATAGEFILRCTVPIETGGKAIQQRYWQFYYAQAGTSASITIEADILPSKPRTDYDLQVMSSPVGVP